MPARVYGVAFSSDGHTLAAGDDNGHIGRGHGNPPQDRYLG